MRRHVYGALGGAIVALNATPTQSQSMDGGRVPGDAQSQVERSGSNVPMPPECGSRTEILCLQEATSQVHAAFFGSQAPDSNAVSRTYRIYIALCARGNWRACHSLSMFLDAPAFQSLIPNIPSRPRSIETLRQAQQLSLVACESQPPDVDACYSSGMDAVLAGNGTQADRRLTRGCNADGASACHTLYQCVTDGADHRECGIENDIHRARLYSQRACALHFQDSCRAFISLFHGSSREIYQTALQALVQICDQEHDSRQDYDACGTLSSEYTSRNGLEFAHRNMRRLLRECAGGTGRRSSCAISEAPALDRRYTSEERARRAAEQRGRMRSSVANNASAESCRARCVVTNLPCANNNPIPVCNAIIADCESHCP